MLQGELIKILDKIGDECTEFFNENIGTPITPTTKDQLVNDFNKRIQPYNIILIREVSIKAYIKVISTPEDPVYRLELKVKHV